LKRKCRLSLLFVLLVMFARAQETPTVKNSTDSLSQQKDLMDVIKTITGSKKTDTVQKTSAVSVLPAIGYNPSIGFLLGVNFLRTFNKGNPETTELSVAQLDVSVTTKKLLIARFRTNIFTEDNKWNFQGNWQYMRNYINDYGLGDEADLDPPVNYPIRFNYFRFTEKAYKRFGKHFYAGAGISIDLRNDIHDEKLDSATSTPHYRYSIDKGFDPQNYFVNGLIANIQYNTKEHPNRPFKGMYAEMNIRYNTKLLGSTKQAGQLYTELRKYWGLSSRNPEHVLAFWYWGSYQLWGKLPYLELPGTAYDTYNRSGRGYTLSRFKGPDFVYMETEYRFPISQVSKLFSGVVFCNFQSFSDADNKGLFQRIEPAAGAGLRILFNKRSRTNICLDYAKGKYGSSGFFFALNEAF
jgi:outer membrane protein assembly factor BamA